MRLVCISDTHGHHRDIVLPLGDLLIFAGDWSVHGEYKETSDFLEWLKQLKGYRKKIIIHGNHDRYVSPFKLMGAYLNKHYHIIYLDSVKFIMDEIMFFGYGSSLPVGSWYHQRTDQEMETDLLLSLSTIHLETEEMIPLKNPRILITHGPAYGILDKVNGKSVGSKTILNWSDNFTHVIHGHIHEGYQPTPEIKGRTQFINCSICNERYHPVNAPVVIDLWESKAAVY